MKFTIRYNEREQCWVLWLKGAGVEVLVCHGETPTELMDKADAIKHAGIEIDPTGAS